MKTSKVLLVVLLAIGFVVGIHGSALGATQAPCVAPVSRISTTTAQLEIFVDGEQQVIPAGIGIVGDQVGPASTVDCSGTIQVSAFEPVSLSSFFMAWGVDFSSSNIGAHYAAKDVEVYVNGAKQNVCPGSVELRPGLRITLLVQTER